MEKNETSITKTYEAAYDEYYDEYLRLVKYINNLSQNGTSTSEILSLLVTVEATIFKNLLKRTETQTERNNIITSISEAHNLLMKTVLNDEEWE